GTGPSHWPGACQTGNRQSPIDIVPRHTFPVKFKDMEFYKYGQELHSHGATLYNNGHTVVLDLGTLKNRSTPSIRDGGLESVYILDHIHFHAPSEHTVNGRRYPLEAHLVHRDHRAPSVPEALKMRDGIAVLGVLYHISEEGNSELQDLADGLAKLNGVEGSKERLPERDGDSMTIDSLLPEERDDFFRYYGSLTTPQCHEAVVWTVFKETVAISEEQLKQFRMPQHNFRPLQDMNHRFVLHNTDSGSRSRSSGIAAPTPFCTLALASVLAAYGLRR
ncbi:hypothetical protein J437_LFUL010584, partial [Ladona fulva]